VARSQDALLALVTLADASAEFPEQRAVYREAMWRLENALVARWVSGR
jgi:hypothetical protein